MSRDPRKSTGRWSVRGAAAVVVCAALLLVLLSVAASAVWPPWMAQDESEPVYPDVTASVDDIRSAMDGPTIARPVGSFNPFLGTEQDPTIA